MAFNKELVAPEAYGRYFVSSTHVATRFPQAAAGGGAASGAHEVGLLVAGIGMDIDALVTPEGALTTAGPGNGTVIDAVPLSAIPPARQPRSAGTGVLSPRGVWTAEEDEILREMVRMYGVRKWAAIARHLHGRVGKQCRERWMNHLRPDIKKNVWTEEEDKQLIEAHKVFGNHWSAIAKYLPGRSENGVKNHWNATKRSLKSSRRFNKVNSEQGPRGQFTLFEAYIRSRSAPAVETDQPTAAAAAAAPPASPPPVPGNLAIVPAGPAAQPAAPASSIPANMAPVPRPAMSLNFPPLPDLNVAADEDAPQEAARSTSLDLFTFTARNNQARGGRANAGGVRNVDVAGPSNAAAAGGSGPADDNEDVVEMASREFMSASEALAKLELPKLKEA